MSMQNTDVNYTNVSTGVWLRIQNKNVQPLTVQIEPWAQYVVLEQYQKCYVFVSTANGSESIAIIDEYLVVSDADVLADESGKIIWDGSDEPYPPLEI